MVTKFGQLVDQPERNLEYTLSQVLLMPSPCGHKIFWQNLIYPPVFGGRKGGFEFVFFFRCYSLHGRLNGHWRHRFFKSKRKKRRKARKETADKDVLITSRNDDRKIVEPIQTTSKHEEMEPFQPVQMN